MSGGYFLIFAITCLKNIYVNVASLPSIKVIYLPNKC